MLVDRPQRIVQNATGKFEGQDLGRLDIYFDGRDIETLADPALGSIGDRFMGCTEDGFIAGWAPEEKITVRLESPRTDEDDEKVAEVQLDGGGDLYFTIWNSTALRNFVPAEFQAVAPFVTLDPSQKLAHAGINSFCFHQLVDLSRELSKRDHT